MKTPPSEAGPCYLRMKILLLENENFSLGGPLPLKPISSDFTNYTLTKNYFLENGIYWQGIYNSEEGKGSYFKLEFLAKMIWKVDLESRFGK